MKTFSAKATDVPRKWWVIDAQDQVLGRVAVKAANLLRERKNGFHATPRHRRFCHCHQCGKSPAHRKEGRTEKLYEFFRLRRRTQIRKRPGAPRSSSRIANRTRRSRNDPAQSSRSECLSQVKSVSRR